MPVKLPEQLTNSDLVPTLRSFTEEDVHLKKDSITGHFFAWIPNRRLWASAQTEQEAINLLAKKYIKP